MTARSILAAALVAVFALVGVAHAASGITPLSPKAGASVPTGESPTFKVRVKGSGAVWVNVCRSASKNKDGVICNRAAYGQAKRGAGGIATFKPKYRDFDDFWLNQPGTYYWQAHRIACPVSKPSGDCLQEGKIVKFTVG